MEIQNIKTPTSFDIGVQKKTSVKGLPFQVAAVGKVSLVAA